MSTLLEEFRRLVDQSQGNAPAGLSEREARILGLVAQGKSNREIADLLSLSEQTIKNRLSAIFDKLKVANRTEAATYAIQQGLISLE
jgi:DNA-binding NarL/FixJ family response regulator